MPRSTPRRGWIEGGLQCFTKHVLRPWMAFPPTARSVVEDAKRSVSRGGSNRCDCAPEPRRRAVVAAIVHSIRAYARDAAAPREWVRDGRAHAVRARHSHAGVPPRKDHLLHRPCSYAPELWLEPAGGSDTDEARLARIVTQACDGEMTSSRQFCNNAGLHG